MPSTEVCFLFGKRHIEKTLSAVERSDLSHFICSQFKVEYFKILLHVLRIGRSRKDNISFLDMPAENDLHVALAVFLSKLCKYAFVNKPLVAMTDRVPALNNGTVFFDTFFNAFC